MERITHRKFEAQIPLRFEDNSVLPEVLAKIKEALRALPKLDVLRYVPQRFVLSLFFFRVSFLFSVSCVVCV